MKFLKILSVIVGVAGFMLLWGAVGGLEQNLCTRAEFVIMAVGGLTLLIGATSFGNKI